MKKREVCRGRWAVKTRCPTTLQASYVLCQWDSAQGSRMFSAEMIWPRPDAVKPPDERGQVGSLSSDAPRFLLICCWCQGTASCWPHQQRNACSIRELIEMRRWTIFWVITQFLFVHFYHRFGVKYCLLIQSLSCDNNGWNMFSSTRWYLPTISHGVVPRRR
jgi:hypothetical protein